MVLEDTVQLYPQSLCLPGGWIEADSLCYARNVQELGHGKFWALNSLKNYFLSALGASPHSSLQEQLTEFSSLTSCLVFCFSSWKRLNISPKNGVFGGKLVLAPASNTCRSGLASPPCALQT